MSICGRKSVTKRGKKIRQGVITAAFNALGDLGRVILWKQSSAGSADYCRTCWWLCRSSFLMGKCHSFSVSPPFKNWDPLLACNQTISGLHGVYHYRHSHPFLLSGSHTHSWHSVEIFSSLVRPRKTLTRAPKFPVLGLFSTWKKTKKKISSKLAFHKLQKPHNFII